MTTPAMLTSATSDGVVHSLILRRFIEVIAAICEATLPAISHLPRSIDDLELRGLGAGQCRCCHAQHDDQRRTERKSAGRHAEHREELCDGAADRRRE